MSSFSGSVGFSRGGSFRSGAVVLLSALLVLPSLLLAQQTTPVSPEPGCPTIPRSAAGGLPATDHVRYLAADALQGREVGTQGERCTAAYLATRFAELGLRPAGTNGTWFQTFPVRSGSTLGRPGTLAISGQPRERGKAWTEYGFSGSGDAAGRLVYAGPGVPPAQGQPADEYAALDLRGAIAVVEASWPGVTGTRADAHYKANALQSRGAVGMIVLLPDGRALPSLEDENRPFARIPAAAVAAPDAETVRTAARAGAQARLATDVRPNMVEGRNVLALIPGSDPQLAQETVVIGAHHDHLGMGGEGSLAPERREIHNGADDNASGTTSLILIAQRLLDGPRPARSVLLIGFAGEERGLLGSSYYVENPLRPLDQTRAMINLDMVGRLKDDALTIFGIATATEWDGMIRQLNTAQRRPFTLNLLPDGFGPSDHSAFYGKGIPVLHFFTGTHAEYHRPADDTPLINGEGIERVAALVADITSRLTGTTARVAQALTPVVAPPPHAVGAPGDPNAAPSSGYGTYFGSIPDMTPQTFGVRITGVREESPAAKAGLREGDVIVSFAGKETPDLYAYTYALQEKKPGDRVEVVVVRGGQRITMTTVLTERP
jgi:hypothetical protein